MSRQSVAVSASGGVPIESWAVAMEIYNVERLNNESNSQFMFTIFLIQLQRGVHSKIAILEWQKVRSSIVDDGKI